jgi:hypothetical protein
MSSIVAFAIGLAVGYMWATARARKAIALGIVTGPRTSVHAFKYRQEIPSIWK